MWTLHDVTDQVKNVAKWIGIGIVGLIIIVLIFKLIGAIRNAITPPPAPTVAYGKIPTITFPPYTKESSTAYTVDTVSGVLPVFPDRLPVFKIEQPTPTLQNLANARAKIAAIGFASTFGQQLLETPLSESKYQWNDGGTPPRTLTMNIDSYDFLLSTSYLSGLSSTSPTLTSQGVDPSTAPGIVEKFLDNMNLLTPDILVDSNSTESASLPHTQLLHMSDSGLVGGDISNAQAIRVDLFQRYVDITDGVDTKFGIKDLPIYYPNPNQSLINAILVPGTGTQPVVASFSYHHQTILQDSSTYPIITSAEAFAQLKSGNAYIAQYDTNTLIAIKSVELGYYLSEDKTDYMMPIIIFKGDATPDGKYNFYAYIPAVSGAYLK